MNWCKECGRWVCTSHECDPKWMCWAPDNGETIDDPRDVRALNAESAVEKFAELDDQESANYSICSGNGEETKVMVCSEDEYEKFKASKHYLPVLLGYMVRGEMEPTYCARETRVES